MKTFGDFLVEAATEDKLKHLEHAEDHHINAGHEGFTHAVNTLFAVHHALNGKRKTPVSITTKYDGSPSVVFGHHPESGKFFVASKSAFNKDPKLNYTPKDVQANHGHAPGLVKKLIHALYHLPKVTPKEGVYQGDMMYAKHDKDVTETPKSFHFKPNTITYSAHKDSPEGHKMKDSRIGVAVHTAYKGKSLEDMKAVYNSGDTGFGAHKDVHVISPKFDPKSVHYTPDAQKEYTHHIQAAMKEHEKLKDYSHMEGHLDHVKTYINSTVKAGTKPDVEGYRKHVSDRLSKGIEKIKTNTVRVKKTEEMSNTLHHVDANKGAFQTMFNVHHHLQNAKNVLVKTMEAGNHSFHHSINGKSTAPEGFVASINNRPTKLVNRQVFSAANLTKEKS